MLAAQNAVASARQRLAQAEAQSAQSVKNGPDQVRVQQSRATAAEAAIQQAQARVEQARLNLSYTRITAPVAGIVNKKNVEVGANLAAGQDLMTIIPLTDLWVTANFKETQLTHMRAGQKVTIKVDAYGGRKFSGAVTQIGGATGSMLSLFPPENATGNYVKVVQRLPVRIDFTNLQQEDGDYVLRPGLSVTPVVESQIEVADSRLFVIPFGCHSQRESAGCGAPHLDFEMWVCGCAYSFTSQAGSHRRSAPPQSASASENLCRTSEPRSQKITSSAMLVAWSAARSRLRAIRIAVIACVLTSGFCCITSISSACTALLASSTASSIESTLSALRASASSSAWIEVRIITPALSPISWMSTGS